MPRSINSFDQRVMEKTNNYSSLTSAQSAPNLAINDFIASGNVCATQPSDIVSNGLVLYLDAGIGNSYPQAGTTWFDLTTNRFVGTFVNNAGYSSANGGGITFNGVTTSNNGSKVTIPYNAAFNPTQLTFGCWLNRTASVNYSHFFGLPAGTTWTLPYTSYGIEFIGTTNQPALVLGWSNNTFDYVFGTATSELDVGKWVTIVGTYDGSVGRIYVNGLFQNSLTLNKTLKTSSQPFIIGAETVTTSEFPLNGRVGSGYVYNRALSAAEILQNFNAQRTRFGV